MKIKQFFKIHIRYAVSVSDEKRPFVQKRRYPLDSASLSLYKSRIQLR